MPPLFPLFSLPHEVAGVRNATILYCTMHNFNLNGIAAAIGLSGLRGSAHLARLQPFLAIHPIYEETRASTLCKPTQQQQKQQQHVQQQQQCKQVKATEKTKSKMPPRGVAWCVLRVANFVTCCCLCCCCLLYCCCC